MSQSMPPGWAYPPSSTCAEVGEHALIAWIADTVGTPTDAGVLIGIGDDAAVVAPRRNHVDVVTTDVQVEGVHFTRSWSRAADVGHRALHVNLSDVAAMGATPRTALLSLGLPGTLEAGWVVECVGAFVQAARAARVQIIGGNITRSPALFIDVTVSGVVKPRQVLGRRGAKAGDELYVSGQLGASAAGLAWLQHAAPGTEPATAAMAEAIARYRRPEARVALGVQVARNRAASACMDTSDGLGDAVRQMAVASGVGVRIEAALLPVAEAVREVAADDAAGVEALAISGGEDFELLFAVPRRARRRFLHATSRAGMPRVSRIGVCTRETDVVIVHADGRQAGLPGGFQHFVTPQEGA